MANPRNRREKSGQWKLECPGQGLLSQPSWAADLPAASDILRLELHLRGGSSCAFRKGLWEGKDPGECRFGAEFQKGGRKENRQEITKVGTVAICFH